jgi:hypothetical protein
MVAGARPASREPFNPEAGFPSRSPGVCHPARCMAPSDRLRNTKTSQLGAPDHFARRSRETECLSSRNTRAPAGNTDIPALCR